MAIFKENNVPRDLILEIGVEELPHGFINPATEQIQQLARAAFDEKRVNYAHVGAHGSPRRLVLWVEQLNENQADLIQEIMGPAKHIAYDENGNPTKAAYGFARGKNGLVDDLYIKKTDKGEYIALTIKKTGQPTIDLLPETLKKIILSIAFPKTMRWSNKSIRFARPINWLLALYGEDVVPLDLDGIGSDRITYGHRYLSPGPFVVKKAGDYFNVIENAQILVNFNVRQQKIKAELNRVAHEIEATVVENEHLLNVVTNLVEVPHAIVCDYKPDYLILPDEVNIISLEEHQKCFSLRDKQGQLLPKFVQISNSDPKNDSTVKIGSERVIDARLADARFFYEEDQKSPLIDKVDALQEVLFQKQLGTVYDKVQRMSASVEEISQMLHLSPDHLAKCQRAVLLSKADLTTNMIGEKEFNKLQGFMGWQYARRNGEDAEVARAIFEHYQPRFADDVLPTTLTGAIVALADKLDTVVGCFGVGIIPTGSQDPYALRRAALGISRIILDRQFTLSIEVLIDISLKNLSDRITRIADEVKADVSNFFKQRLNTILSEDGFDYDVLDAVLSITYEYFADAKLRSESIQAIRKHPDFDSIAAANKRVTNILKKADEWPPVDVNLFEQDEEKTVYATYLEIKPRVNACIDQHDYSQALQLLVGLRKSIDNYFDHVFVMAEDEQLRLNRLAMLAEIKSTFDRIADFSKIVVSSEK